MSRENVHTVYDRLDAKGYFRANPANRDSIDPMTRESAYKGPVPFPMMLYHPKGKFRVTTRATAEQTPFGPQMLNEQKELIHKIVNNQAEYDAAMKEGWWEHPSDSIAAGFTAEDIANGAVAPPKSAESRVPKLEEEIARLIRELAMAKSGPRQSDIPADDEE